MKKLEGKVAVITGGNSGIGLSSAKMLANEGASVIIIGRDSKTLEAAKKEIGHDVLAIKADVGEVTEIEKVYSEVKAKFKKIDILFANAGIANFVPLSDVTEKFYDQIMDVNVKGLFFTIQKAVPMMSSGGSIILTSSSLQGRALPGGSVYGASKAAVRSLGRGFAMDLADRGIRVNVLSPGPIETPIFGRMGAPADQVKAMTENMSKRVPMKRMGNADEIARVVLFLASDDSSFMCGSEVAVDGGVAQL